MLQVIHDTQCHRSKMGVIYMCNHENKVPSRLSPQWLCGNSCTYAHDVYRTSCAEVHELTQGHCGDNREGTLFS